MPAGVANSELNPSTLSPHSPHSRLLQLTPDFDFCEAAQQPSNPSANDAAPSRIIACNDGKRQALVAFVNPDYTLGKPAEVER